MTKTHSIFVTGHRGLVGSAILRQLGRQGKGNIITRTHAQLDLTRQQLVEDFFASENIKEVYLAAAKVGGIQANNSYPAEFIYENLMIECNIINAAHRANVPKLLLLGSSCIYPRLAAQPITEDALLTGTLEPTNEPYAIAKIAGIKLCESYNRQYERDYRSLMPSNLYGPNDNFHPEDSHVIPAMLRKFHEATKQQAPEVILWGSGNPRREFLHVDDLAAACTLMMDLDKATYQAHTSPMLSHINIGSGHECTIKELAETVAEVTGYQGRVSFDSSKPDGTPRKLMDISLANKLGWKPRISLTEGLRQTYEWYLSMYCQ